MAACVCLDVELAVFGPHAPRHRIQQSSQARNVCVAIDAWGAARFAATRDLFGLNRSRVFLALCLTGGFMVAEAVGGILSGSLALLAEAAHLLIDTLGWFDTARGGRASRNAFLDVP